MPWISVAIIAVLLAACAPSAQAQERKYVGGHVGVGFPIVRRAGGEAESIRDFFQLFFHAAITVNGPGRLYFDLELVPIFVDRPRQIFFVVNPGFLWRFGHGWAAGSRVAFNVRTAELGITPLVVKSWPIKHSFFNAYFVETDFIFRFDRPVGGPSTNPFIFNVVFGVAF